MKKVFVVMLSFIMIFSIVEISSFVIAEPVYELTIQEQVVTINGNVGIADTHEVALKVFKSGVDIDNSTPEDLIYYNILKADSSGTFEFQFPLYELIGIFEYQLICTDANFEVRDEFRYTPIGDRTMFAEVEYKINGSEVETIEDGNLIITPKIINDATRKDVSCIVAIYEGNQLIDIKIRTHGFLEGDTYYSIPSIDMGNVTNDMQVKTLLWSNDDLIKPLDSISVLE